MQLEAIIKLEYSVVTLLYLVTVLVFCCTQYGTLFIGFHPESTADHV
jgi:hypothetical protein